MKKSSDLFTEQRFSRMRESRGTKSRDHLYRIMALAAVVRTECLSVPRYTNCWWWKVKANHVSRWTSLNADGSLKIVRRGRPSLRDLLQLVGRLYPWISSLPPQNDKSKNYPWMLSFSIFGSLEWKKRPDRVGSVYEISDILDLGHSNDEFRFSSR